MDGQQLSLSTPTAGRAGADRLSTPAVARRVLQGVGGGLAIALAALTPWAEFSSDGITIGAVLLPAMLLALFTAIVAIGLCFFAASVWGLIRRLPGHARLGLIAVSLIGTLSFAGLEYGYVRTSGLNIYEYRPAFRLLCYTIGIALLACTVPEELGANFAYLIRRRQIGLRTIIELAIAVCAAGALIGVFVLEGMPHIIDGTSYLLQARTYAAGRLALDTPMHPALFACELMHFRVTDAGYYSKYPPGWPALLAVFDAASVPWLANAVLAALLVLITYGLVAERGDRRLAGLSAIVVALCPWLWFNAATMMSHMASAVFLWLFLWLLIRAVRTHARHLMLLAGGSLGIAVLIRPADAAFFALPCAIAGVCWIIRSPGKWLTRLPLLAIGALPGVIAYLWINHTLTGSSGSTTYGGGQHSILFSQAPESIGHALIWLHQGFADFSAAWFAGAAPAAVLLLCGAFFGRRALRGQWLVLACAASLFLCYGIFVFGGRSWVGPRWYVPLIPAAAMMMAAGFEAASQAGRMRSPSGVLAAGHLRASMVACVVVFGIAVPMRVIELIHQPPHGIDGTAIAMIEQAQLKDAVVAMPVNGLDASTGKPNYKRGIAGMWSMQAPFESGDVIYVSAIDGWQAMAAEAWPDRTRYSMSNRAGDWTLTPELVGTHNGQAEASP